MYSISSRQTARNYYVSLQISILRGRSSNTFNPISLLFSITNDSVEVLLFHCRRVDSAAVAATERREQWKKNNEFRQIFNGRHSTISLLLLLLFDQRAPITQQENQWNEELCVRFVCFWFFFFCSRSQSLTRLKICQCSCAMFVRPWSILLYTLAVCVHDCVRQNAQNYSLQALTRTSHTSTHNAHIYMQSANVWEHFVKEWLLLLLSYWTVNKMETVVGTSAYIIHIACGSVCDKIYNWRAICITI